MVRKRWAVVSLGTAILLVLGASMVAAGVVVTGQGNSLAVIKTVSKVSPQATTSTSWVDVSGAVRRATSTGTTNLFVGEFTAETSCHFVDNVWEPSGSISDEEFCLVRIIVKDLAGSTVGIMNPVDDVANFDSPVLGSTQTCNGPNGCASDGGAFTIHGHAANRSISGLAAATYDFQVQFRVGNSGLEHHLDDWHYTLTRYTA